MKTMEVSLSHSIYVSKKPKIRTTTSMNLFNSTAATSHKCSSSSHIIILDTAVKWPPMRIHPATWATAATVRTRGNRLSDRISTVYRRHRRCRRHTRRRKRLSKTTTTAIWIIVSVRWIWIISSMRWHTIAPMLCDSESMSTSSRNCWRAHGMIWIMRTRPCRVALATRLATQVKDTNIN